MMLAVRSEKLSFTALRVLIAALVVVGLVFLGDALDDSPDSAGKTVWPVVRAAPDSCGLAAQPFPRAGVVRFSALCDLEQRASVLTLEGESSRDEQRVLSRPGEVVGQVFRGSRSLGRCLVWPGRAPSVRCRPAGTEPFPQRVQARIVLRVAPPECGPKWTLKASFDKETDSREKVAPVVWRRCAVAAGNPAAISATQG
jgi:hypothetical protein